MKVIKMRPKKKPCCGGDHPFHYRVMDFILKAVIKREGTPDFNKWSNAGHFDFTLGGITQSFCLAFDWEKNGCHEQAETQIEHLQEAYEHLMNTWEEIKRESRTR